MQFSDGRARYDGLLVKLERRWAKRYEFRIAYALSRRLWTSDTARSEDEIDLEELVHRISSQSSVPVSGCGDDSAGAVLAQMIGMKNITLQQKRPAPIKGWANALHCHSHALSTSEKLSN